jgi:two-component system, sensor histidine kinase and response regulator
LKSTEEQQIQKRTGTVAVKQSILVIDDSPDMLMLQRTVLELEGFEVFTAQSGAEAFQMLSKIDEPDLILLDVQMDDMTGPEFLAILEQREPRIVENVPVVYLTAADKGVEDKAIGYIRKLTDIDEFLVAVYRFIEMGRRAPSKH